MRNTRLNRLAAAIAVIGIGTLLLAITLLVSSATPKSVTPIAKATSMVIDPDLTLRLNKLVSVQKLVISGTDSLTVDLVIQSNNAVPLEQSVSDILQKAIAEREIVFNYQIGQPVRMYTISISKPDSAIPIMLQSAQTTSSDNSQNLKSPGAKSLDSQWTSTVISENLYLPPFHLYEITVTNMPFGSSVQQVADVVMVADDVDTLNSSLEQLVTSLSPLIDKINADPRGQVAIFSIKVMDPNGRLLYGQVLDNDLKTFWIQFAEGVQRYTTWGKVGGPASTSIPTGDSPLTSPVLPVLTAVPESAHNQSVQP